MTPDGQDHAVRRHRRPAARAPTSTPTRSSRPCSSSGSRRPATTTPCSTSGARTPSSCSTTRRSPARPCCSPDPTSAPARAASTPSGRCATTGSRRCSRPKFGDIFRGNSGKQGLLTGTVTEAEIEAFWAAIAAQPGIPATVDLVARTVADRRPRSPIRDRRLHSMEALGRPRRHRSHPARRSADHGVRRHPRKLAAPHSSRSLARWFSWIRSPQDAAKAGLRVGLKSDADRHPRRQAAERDASTCAEPRTSPPRRWSRRCSARPRACCKTCPTSRDVGVVTGMLGAYGVAVTSPEEGQLLLDPTNVERAHFAEIDALAGSSRIPILFCGPLLHRLGEALIPDLGGCRIGDRPIDFHMDALRAFGAVVDKSYEGIRITAPDGLHGANIELPYPSVGATEQVLLTAVRAQGRHRAEERGDRARDHGSHRDPAEDGRHHLDGAEPHHLHRGRRQAHRLHAPRDLRPQRGGILGVGGARDRRRHLRRGRQAARADDVPQRVPQGGRRVRRARRRHPVLPRRARSSRCRSRPTCTPAS